jgi:pyruvate formate lyase activating enzyme
LIGNIFNIQRFSLDDGPGIRTTVFLKGCPLRCLWCSNPESQNARPEIAHRPAVCNKCMKCTEICSNKAISVDSKGVYIDRERCTNCGNCVKVCGPEALKILGEAKSVEDIFQEIKKDIRFYRDSGGGLTVSGGEPLFQPDFTIELLKRCQAEGIHTSIETCGYGDQTSLEEVLKYTSLVLFDVKLIDPSLHKQATGQSNSIILHNLRLARATGTPLITRVPLIPGFNDSEKEITAIAHTIADTGKQKEVHLLPYHKWGIAKYQQLDREYPLNNLERPTQEKIQKCKDILESCGFICKITG